MKNKQNPFRVFRVFRGLFYKFWHNKKRTPPAKPATLFLFKPNL